MLARARRRRPRGRRTPTAGSRSRRRGRSASRPTSRSSRRPATTCCSTAPLPGDAAADRAAVLDALRRGPLLRRPRRARAGRRLPLHGRGRPRASAGRWATTSPRAEGLRAARRRARARGHARRPPARRQGGGGGTERARRGACPAPASTAWRPACRAGPCPGSSRTPSTSTTTATREARRRRAAWPGPPPPAARESARSPRSTGSAALQPGVRPRPRGWTPASPRPGAGPDGARRPEARLPARRAHGRRSPSPGARS